MRTFSISDGISTKSVALSLTLSLLGAQSEAEATKKYITGPTQNQLSSANLQQTTRASVTQILDTVTPRLRACLDATKGDLVCELLESAWGDQKRENKILAYFLERETARMQSLRNSPQKETARAILDKISQIIMTLIAKGTVVSLERAELIGNMQQPLIDYLALTGFATIAELGYANLPRTTIDAEIMRDADWKGHLNDWRVRITKDTRIPVTDRTRMINALNEMRDRRFDFDVEKFEIAKSVFIALKQKNGLSD